MADVLTIQELNTIIGDIIKANLKYEIAVKGELANFKISGKNLYFTLVDAESSISACFWNYEAAKVNLKQLKNGSSVSVRGYIYAYVKKGTYNLTVRHIETKGGTGEQALELENLKLFYKDKGYFDSSKKKEIPTNITRLGLITSKDGAALQDFLYELRRHYYKGFVHVYPCIVQGTSCPMDVAKAIKMLDKENLDVIVVTRGGGSDDDLSGFSTPPVIEAIYKATTPIISAIGHEVDYVLSDYVADKRCPTPSIAGETIGHNHCYSFSAETIDYRLHGYKQTLLTKIERLIFELNKEISNVSNIHNNADRQLLIIKSFADSMGRRLRSSIDDKIEELTKEVGNVLSVYDNADKYLSLIKSRATSMNVLLQTRINEVHIELVNDINTIQNSDPKHVMKQGYVILHTCAKGTVITSIKQLEQLKVTRLKIKLLDGEIEVIIPAKK